MIGNFVILFLILAAQVSAWNLQQSKVNLKPIGAKLSGLICAGCMILSQAPPTFAAVGEGDLPEGSLAFSRLLKYQGDWNKLAGSVTDRKGVVEEKEVMGIKIFLKQLANEYYDMDLLSRSINDPKKNEAAKDLAKTFRKQIRELDDAAGDNNLNKLIENYPTTAGELKEFFELLSDVPDKL